MGTIPTIATLASGAVVTSAYLNAIKAQNDFWALTPRCYAYQTSATALTTAGNPQVIGLDTEVYDIVQSGDSPMHDNATNNSRIVARTAGKYEIAAQVVFNNNATGARSGYIRLNAAGSWTGGTLLSQSTQQAVTGGFATAIVMPVIEVALNAGDYVELFGYQASTITLNTSTGLGITFLRMKLTGS